MVRGADGLEVLISGTSEGPNANHIARARLALSHIEDAASLSIRLLQSFVHESGSWSFDELNVGQDADQNRCEFQTALSFSPSNGSDSYGYTSFVVCFRSFQDSKRTRIHPYKTVIEFL